MDNPQFDTVQLESNKPEYLSLLCCFSVATWSAVDGRGRAEVVVAIVSTLRGS